MARPTSVMLARDRDVIPVLLGIHAVQEPRILDVTHNKGVMWKGLDYHVTTMDIDERHCTDLVGDFRDIPAADGSFDVIVFDPPHLPTNAASVGSSGMWRDNYGITNEGDYRSGDNVSEAFTPFLIEAKRVLSPEGIVLAKIADLTHNHRYQWQHVDFIVAAQCAGMTPCDMVVKADPNAGRLMSSKWQNVKHVRKAHAYWIVVRNSPKCEAHNATTDGEVS